ncbi:MAG: DUF1353 domain-containing protein [Pseudomonadota bacterium]
MIESRGRVYVIPTGFITDYSSMPWFSRMIVRWSKVDLAGVVHDWIFETGIVSLNEANLVWRDVATSGTHSANKIQANVAYLGLVAGGWRSWRKYRNGKRRNQNIETLVKKADGYDLAGLTA